MYAAALSILLLACQAPGSSRPSGGADGSTLPGDGGSADGTGSDGTGDDGGTTVPPPPLAGNQGLLIAQSWDLEEAPVGAGAGSYRVIVLQESMTSILSEVRAANPDALILAYQKGGGMRSDGGDHPSTGVSTQEAEAGHEGWFLHDAEGNRLEYCDYADVFVADVGDVDFQARWLENVATRLTNDGFDGVMIDDINTFPGHCLGSKGTPIAEYADDEAYGDAVVAFMAAVGPPLVDLGFIVAPNVAMNPWDATMRAQTLAIFPSVSHLFREYWMRWNSSPNFTGDEWEDTLTLMEDAQSAGIGMLALTYGPGEEGTTEGQRYGRASFLLAWDGRSPSAWGYRGEEVDPWTAEWAGDLGLPEEARTAEGVGWKRRYGYGTVLVNPDEESSQAFTLEADHTDSDGAVVQSYELGPGQGVMLRLTEDPDAD